VFGTTQEQHDQRLIATLDHIKTAGVSLNKAKYKFSVSSVKFLGHIVIKADLDKTAAITGLHRFMGLAHLLGKFSCHLAHLTHPACLVQIEHGCGVQIKNWLSTRTNYANSACFVLGSDTKVATDTSSFGLGAVLLQRIANNWRPVAYAPRALSEMERRYVHIEKEALTVTWACTKFSDYLLGSKFLIETDHKPLVLLLNTKHLDCLPPCILCFRLHLAKYNYTVVHIPGKPLYAADVLSQASTSPITPIKDDSLQDDEEPLASTVVSFLPAEVSGLWKMVKNQMRVR